MTEKEIQAFVFFIDELQTLLPGIKFGMNTFNGGDSKDSFVKARFEFSFNQSVIKGTTYDTGKN
jgi:hypothetical protein